MKTSNVLEGTAFPTGAARPKSTHKTRNRTYVVIAVIAMFSTLAGFSLTYVVPLASGSFEGRGMLHIHGALYFVWLVVFILQPSLVQAGNTALHKKIGIAGFVLAGIMIVMGVAVSVTGARLNSPGLVVAGLQSHQFLLIPLTDMILFSLFLAYSLANLKRFEYHKRLMVLATVALLPAAFGRLSAMLGLANPMAIILFSESMLIGIIAHEWLMTKKLHPVYKWGGGFMFVVHILRFPIAGSALWTSIGQWIIS